MTMYSINLKKLPFDSAALIVASQCTQTSSKHSSQLSPLQPRLGTSLPVKWWTAHACANMWRLVNRSQSLSDGNIRFLAGAAHSGDFGGGNSTFPLDERGSHVLPMTARAPGRMRKPGTAPASFFVRVAVLAWVRVWEKKEKWAWWIWFDVYIKLFVMYSTYYFCLLVAATLRIMKKIANEHKEKTNMFVWKVS